MIHAIHYSGSSSEEESVNNMSSLDSAEIGSWWFNCQMSIGSRLWLCESKQRDITWDETGWHIWSGYICAMTRLPGGIMLTGTTYDDIISQLILMSKPHKKHHGASQHFLTFRLSTNMHNISHMDRWIYFPYMYDVISITSVAPFTNMV